LIRKDGLDVVLSFKRDVSPQGHHPCFLAKGFQVRPDKGVRDLGETVKINVRGKGHPAAVNLQDGPASFNVWNRNDDFSIEPAWPAQGGIDQLRDIGRADDNHMPSGDHAIHEGQELRDHPAQGSATSSRECPPTSAVGS
jgi:hypothetical protein